MLGIFAEFLLIFFCFRVQVCGVRPEVELDADWMGVNATGSMIALVGRNGAAVLKAVGAGQMQSLAVGATFFQTHPSVRVLKAQWHPASLSHLALLCSDGCLRLYSTNTSMSEPEQVLRPALPADVRAVSFAFAASSGWSHFAVYFAGSDNGIYCQCPFVPQHMVIPPALLEELTQFQEGEIARLTAANKAALAAVGDSRKMVRKTARQLKAANRALSWLRGGMDAGQEPAVQPLVSAEELEPLEKASERVCDIAIISAKFPVLCVLYESGLLELRLQLQSPAPLWETGGKAHRDMLGWVILIDRADVAPSILKGLGSSLMPSNAPLPALYQDPVVRDRWFVLHGGGVDFFVLDKLDGALDQVERALREEEQSEQQQQFPELPRVELISLLQQDLTLEEGRLRGFAVVASAVASGDAWFACLDIGGSLVTVDLMAPLDELTLLGTDEDEAVPAGTAFQKESAWQVDYREWEQRRPKPIPKVDFRKKSRLDQLALFKDQSLAYSRHAIHLKEGQTLLRDARKELAERGTNVGAELAEHEKRVRRIEEREATFQDRLGLAQRNHENLVARVAAIESICVLIQPALTRAERAYQQELRARSSDAAQMEMDLKGLEKFVDTNPQLFKPAPTNKAISLDDRQLRRIEKHLETQNEELDKLVNQVKQLQLGTK